MKKNKNLSFFFTLILTILYCIGGTLLMSIIMNINHKLADYYYIVAGVVNIVIGLIVIVLVLVFKKHITKVHLKSFTYGLFVYGLPLMLFYIYHTFTSVRWIFTEGTSYCQEQFKSMLLVMIFYYLTVGFAEEMVFRSGFLTYLLPFNSQPSKLRVVVACMYSAILFGAIHLISLLTEPEKEISRIVLTVILGAFIGYVFAVIFVKTKNVIVVMILHSLWDFTNFCNSVMIEDKYRYGGSYDFACYQIPIIVIMVIIATVVLCRSKTEEI